MQNRITVALQRTNQLKCHTHARKLFKFGRAVFAVGIDNSHMKEVLHGLRVTLKGRVKGHHEREGLNEATLTRCSIKPVVVKTEEEWEAEQAAQNHPETQTP